MAGPLIRYALLTIDFKGHTIRVIIIPQRTLHHAVSAISPPPPPPPLLATSIENEANTENGTCAGKLCYCFV